MAKFRFHKFAAVAVLVATAAWVATGHFSSVGSEVSAADAPTAVEEKPQAAPRTVAVVTPPRADHARTIRVSGRTEADQRSVLAARISGVIADLPVRQGQRVSKGDLILRLDAEGKVAAVDMAEAMLSQREAEFAAAERLSQSGNIAKLQLDNARTALATARSQLESAEAELARNEVRAPFDGLVDRVPVEPGSMVLQGAEIATVLALDPILAVGEVSEQNLAQLEIGNPADVKLVNGQSVQGTLRYISRDATDATRTFRVEIAVPNPDRAIPAGMTTEITLRAAPTEAVMLPRSVVTLGGDGDLGIRAVDPSDKVVFFPIDIVEDTPDGLVLAGIPAEARVIVAGQEMVTEGETVKPVPADPSLLTKLAGKPAETD